MKMRASQSNCHFVDFPRLEIQETVKREFGFYQGERSQNQSPEINPFTPEGSEFGTNRQNEQYNVQFDLRRLLMNMHSLDQQGLSSLPQKIDTIKEADESGYTSDSYSDAGGIPQSFFEGLARVLSSRTEEFIDEFCNTCKKATPTMMSSEVKDKFRKKDYFMEYKDCFSSKNSNSGILNHTQSLLKPQIINFDSEMGDSSLLKTRQLISHSEQPGSFSSFLNRVKQCLNAVQHLRSDAIKLICRAEQEKENSSFVANSTFQNSEVSQCQEFVLKLIYEIDKFDKGLDDIFKAERVTQNASWGQENYEGDLSEGRYQGPSPNNNFGLARGQLSTIQKNNHRNSNGDIEEMLDTLGTEIKESNQLLEMLQKGSAKSIRERDNRLSQQLPLSEFLRAELAKISISASQQPTRDNWPTAYEDQLAHRTTNSFKAQGQLGDRQYIVTPKPTTKSILKNSNSQ